MIKVNEIVPVFALLLAAVVSWLSLDLLHRYTTARVALAEKQCGDTAYIIYKSHDDQPEDRKTENWLARIGECATIGAEYMQGW